MFSTVKTALVLVLACSALTACGGAAPARIYTSESFSPSSRDASVPVATYNSSAFASPTRNPARSDVASAPANRKHGTF
jgi:hypothetical protein